MSAIIETHTRGQYHVPENPRAVRDELRLGATIGMATIFRTTHGQDIALTSADVRRIRHPHEHRPWARRAAATATLLLIVTPCYIIGVTAMSLGAYAIAAELAGNGPDINIPGWAIFPGLALWYAGGAIGTRAADTLGI